MLTSKQALVCNFFRRYKFLTEIDYPHEIVYEVMSPPATPEEKAWDKSLKHYERLTSISDVGLVQYNLFYF